MANRFTKTTINWVEFAKRVPPDQKAKFLAFKAKADKYLRSVQENPPEPPKIDWDAYVRIVAAPGIVEKLKSEYAEYEVPYPEDKLSDEVDEQWKSLEPEIKEYCAELQKDIEAAQKELDRIDALPKFDDMTMEMVYDLDPKKAFDPVNRPTFWPHNPEEQLGYKSPEQESMEQNKLNDQQQNTQK